MKVFFSVGEPSGDEHAARLIQELRRQYPSFEAVGFGGEKMRKAGCRLDFLLTDLAVMGFARVVPLLAKFYRVAQQARKIFENDPPDAVVLVDFPGFNWHIARYAKQRGIPVFYYLPPQIWAWANWRVEKVRKYVDHVLCCFPFEPDWYASHGIQAEYVGHPALQSLQEKPLDPQFTRDTARPMLGILPGSRKAEVTGNFPLQLEVARSLFARNPNVRFAVACYKQAHRTYCQKLVQKYPELPIELHLGKTSEIIEHSAACLMVSGSVSLELLARATPAVVLYRCAWHIYWLGLRMLQCPYMSLPNLFAQKPLMPEFPVVGCPTTTRLQMTNLLHWWLTDPEERARKAEELQQLRDSVRVENALGIAASKILAKLQPLSRQRAA